MNAYQEFESFLRTLDMTPEMRQHILNKFEDLRTNIIDESDQARAESHLDGRS